MTALFAGIGLLATVAVVTWAWTKSKQETKDKK